MNARRGDSPERLLEGEATAFERRVLAQALAREPSKELTQRMAQALGVGVTTLAAPPSPPAPAPVTPAVTSSAVATWVWVSAGVVTLSVVGAVVGLRPGRVAPEARPARSLEMPAPAVRPVPDGVPGPVPSVVAPPLSARTAVAASELRGEIELVDSARAAVAQNAGSRALEVLGRYQARYPRGSFVPEATAVKVEALMQLGRTQEARALAARFVAAHPGTLLADRVAAVAGVPPR